MSVSWSCGTIQFEKAIGLARLPRNKGKWEPNTPVDCRHRERCPRKQQAGT